MWLQWYFRVGMAALAGASAYGLIRFRPRWGWAKGAALVAIGVCGLVSLIALVPAGYLGWRALLHPRTSSDEELFEGVRYLRETRDSPRKMVAHIVMVELTAPGISFLVTQPEAEMKPSLRAKTVEQFLKENGLQVAVNGNFFEPFHSNAPWDYYPHTGDAVRVLGRAASMGEVYSTQVWADATLYLSETNSAGMGGRVDRMWNAISGDRWLIRHGKILADEEQKVYPRCGVGLSERADRLVLVLVDGKQPGYSEGATLAELAELLEGYGAHEAINLDGGGSVTLVAAGADGEPEVLNSPIHTRIPGRPRPVANHLGILAKPIRSVK